MRRKVRQIMPLERTGVNQELAHYRFAIYSFIYRAKGKNGSLRCLLMAWWNCWRVARQ
jgi:hypothetical protein